jgi:hypothetical protein
MKRIILEFSVTNPDAVIERHKGALIAFAAHLLQSKAARTEAVEEALATQVLDGLRTALHDKLDAEGIMAELHIGLEGEVARGPTEASAQPSAPVRDAE